MLGSRSKARKKSEAESNSPLDAKKQALLQQEQRIHEEIARRQKLIEDAPRLAEEAARRRREELIQRKSRTEARFTSQVALNDPRHSYEFNVTAAAPQKALRKHRNQGMFTFFLLLLVLAAVVTWVYYRLFS